MPRARLDQQTLDQLIEEYNNPNIGHLTFAKAKVALNSAFYGTLAGSGGYVASKIMEGVGIVQDLADRVNIIARTPLNLLTPQVVQSNPNFHQQYWQGVAPYIVGGAVLAGITLGVILKYGEYQNARRQAIRDKRQEIVYQLITALAYRIEDINQKMLAIPGQIRAQLGPGYNQGEGGMKR